MQVPAGSSGLVQLVHPVADARLHRRVILSCLLVIGEGPIGRVVAAAFARGILGRASEPVVYEDTQTGRRRFAAYDNGLLTGMLFLAPEPVAVSREWAVSQLAGTDAILSRRNSVLAGRPGAGAVDRGATVCACFGIGANEIAAAARGGCCTVAAIGEATQAGTNCGSCRPEIKRIINDHALAKAV